MFRLPRLTIFGRSLLLIALEVLANVGCWAAAAAMFATKEDTRSILGLALLAWDGGELMQEQTQDLMQIILGEDDWISKNNTSAIDNATRGLLGMGQTPVTCGLFFSLGHSTIVIVVNVAIAVSTDIADKLDNVGEVGGIIGASISGSFLFIVAVTNSIILWRVLKRRRDQKRKASQRAESDEDYSNDAYDPKKDHMLMMRIIGPVITFVNKPWKMYPVGVLFGFGFDTASSIALLAVSALAKKDSRGNSIPSHYIVILPFLFTAGMTLVDSLDSIMMLYSYAGFPERSFRILEGAEKERTRDPAIAMPGEDVPQVQAEVVSPTTSHTPLNHGKEEDEEARARDRRVKMNMMSGLSIILTLMSILVAFSISLITIMGLIGENCRSCREAAEAEDGGGLAGRWWRAWAEANDNSGYIGAGIVGAFVFVVIAWYGGRWAVRRMQRRDITLQEAEPQ
ncbi:hypothetical protein AAF712_005902 [Marasmius tenuissimus]|uniref:Nickel/cobalt efflux system n=1 Tax=Marasmius tenuissimus TaxID=585030 RepID=A0ABR3A0R5_9AGAR